MKKFLFLLLFIFHFALHAQQVKTEPLFVLDGKIIKDINSLNPNSLEKLQVIKGKEATDKYGESGKYGVIEITSKKLVSVPPKRESISPQVTQIWEQSPTVITAGKNSGDAPSDAIILFDGKDLSKWTSESGNSAPWQVSDGSMTVVAGTGAIKTKQVFGDIQLHIEWRTPSEVKGEGQDRGNSGIFFQEQYELQVLDSYENSTYSNGQAGAIYKQYIPLVNASRKPGEWQTYDVVYTAPRFSENNGRVIVPAYITVFQNGVIIQNHVQLTGPTENQGLPVYKTHGKKSIVLQDHSTLVSYRNIWVREL